MKSRRKFWDLVICRKNYVDLHICVTDFNCTGHFKIPTFAP
jgi:hypothetical protein